MANDAPIENGNPLPDQMAEGGGHRDVGGGHSRPEGSGHIERNVRIERRVEGPPILTMVSPFDVHHDDTGSDRSGRRSPLPVFPLKSALSNTSNAATIGDFDGSRSIKRNVSWADFNNGSALTTVVEFERDPIPSSPTSIDSWDDSRHSVCCCCTVM